MSNGFNPVNMVSQIALAAVTGGASIVAQMALQVVSMIAKEVIQQVGQQLGLPQPVIDAAQGAFDAATGNAAGATQEFQQAASGFAGGALGAASGFAQQFNPTPQQAGEFDRSVSQARNQVTDAAQEQAEAYLKDALEGKDEDGGSNRAKRQARLQGVSGESFLMQLAIALGGVIDNKMEEQLALAKEIDGKKSSGDDSTVSTDSAKLQALAQEISLMSNALTNSIKTIGESLTTMARKG